jgi:hypothetical protein
MTTGRHALRPAGCQQPARVRPYRTADESTRLTDACAPRSATLPECRVTRHAEALTAPGAGRNARFFYESSTACCGASSGLAARACDALPG